MNMQDTFKKETKNKIKEKLSIKNEMAVPKLSKIVLNMGVKDALLDKKNVEKMRAVMTQIAGQRPKVGKAKKAISTFKLRQGDEVGVSVTLRGKRMYDFYEKLVSIVLPRLKDFHGVRNTSFDGRGNYTLGFAEFSVFPEIDLGKVERMQGLEVCINTTARNDKEGHGLLEAMGMPFQKEKIEKKKG